MGRGRHGGWGMWIWTVGAQGFINVHLSQFGTCRNRGTFHRSCLHTVVGEGVGLSALAR